MTGFPNVRFGGEIFVTPALTKVPTSYLLGGQILLNRPKKGVICVIKTIIGGRIRQT